MHFYEWNIGDFAKKTQHLSNEEELAYRRALDMYYDTENPLSGGLATLSRRLRVDENVLKNVMHEFFPDGKNKHADEKIAEYYKYIDKQKANGRKGGRPKSDTKEPTANPPLSQNNPVPSQPLTTNTLTTKPLTSIKPSRKIALDDGFDEFWQAYPKKTGKDAALKSWGKVKAKIDDVLLSLYWQKESDQWCRNDGQFIPNPATYLNQGRWKDERPESNMENPF